MKKIIVTLMVLFWAGVASANPITVDAFYSPDSVTIAHLETFRSAVVNGINNADGGLIQARTITPEKMTENADVTIFRDEAFNDFVYTGLLMPTSASLTSTTTAGTAYIAGQRVKKDATANTYTATKFTYVDLDSNGTYKYTEVTPDVAPAVAAGTVRLARVESNSSAVVAVTDLRIQSITLENRQADNYRTGMYMRGSNTTEDNVWIMPGITYWGNVRLVKTTITELNLPTAGHWIAGAGSQANATMGYVAINNAGQIYLTTTAPAYVDLAGNTVGQKRYIKVGSTYYRCLGWFYMNGNKTSPGTAGDDISPWEWGNFQTDIPSRNFKHVSADSVTTVPYFDDLPDSTINFYVPAGQSVKILGSLTGYSTTTGYAFSGAIELDGVLLQDTEVTNSSTSTANANNGGASMTPIFVTPELEPGNHVAKLSWRSGGSYSAHCTWANIIVEVE